MPKTKVTSTRAKPYAKPRDRARGSKTKPGNTLSPSLKPTLEIFQDPKNPKTAIKDSAHSLTKDFVLQLILTKLEASKTCDWHELSLKLGTEGKDMVKVSQGKTAEGWTGSELYDFYHNVSHAFSCSPVHHSPESEDPTGTQDRSCALDFLTFPFADSIGAGGHSWRRRRRDGRPRY